MNWLIVVPAVIVATPAAIMAHNVLEVRRWCRAPGVVLSTGLARMRHTRSSARSFRPVIRYRYTVNGTDHHSAVLIHGMTCGGNEGWARRIIDAYPPGAPVTVLHHPTQPERACLKATFGFFGWVLVVLAALLFLLAASL